jgi:hypothetical protein
MVCPLSSELKVACEIWHYQNNGQKVWFGKLGLLYTSAWLGFSFWLLYFYVLPAMKEIVPPPSVGISIDPSVILAYNIVGGVLCILGLVLIGFIIYYEHWSKLK